MLVHALVAAVGADPEPSILAILNGLDKVLAHLLRRRLLVALLGQDHLAQLLLVPVGRRLLLLLLTLLFSGVGVQVPLLRLALEREVVGKLALLALLAVALLEEDAHYRLGVDAKRHLLDLGGAVEQRVGLPLGILGCLLLALALGLLGLLLLLLGAATGAQVLLHLLDLPLRLGSLLVLHAKRAVLDHLAGRLLGLGSALVLLALFRHGGWFGGGVFLKRRGQKSCWLKKGPEPLRISDSRAGGEMQDAVEARVSRRCRRLRFFGRTAARGAQELETKPVC